MYSAALILHNYTRWLVVVVMVWALVQVWGGWLLKRDWGRWERWACLAFGVMTSVQSVLGFILFFLPTGLAQAAWRDIGSAMAVRDLRFFGLEHPLQMFIAIGLVHLGWSRSRRAEETAKKYRWAAITFGVATLLILSAIPWWRPLLRL